MKEMLRHVGVPVLKMETTLKNVMPANVDPQLYKGDNAIDMVTNNAGAVKCYDQTIIMLGRNGKIKEKLEAKRMEKIDSYLEQLKLGNIQFAPVVLSALGAEDQSFIDFIDYCKGIAVENSVHFPTSYYISKISHFLVYHIGIKTAKCYFDIKCC
jgi:hypothetical protein